MLTICSPFNSLAELIKNIELQHKNILKFKDKINKYRPIKMVLKVLELKLNKKKQKTEQFRLIKYNKNLKNIK